MNYYFNFINNNKINNNNNTNNGNDQEIIFPYICHFISTLIRLV
jgi:hypothetical protein